MLSENVCSRLEVEDLQVDEDREQLVVPLLEWEEDCERLLDLRLTRGLEGVAECAEQNFGELLWPSLLLLLSLPSCSKPREPEYELGVAPLSRHLAWG